MVPLVHIGTLSNLFSPGPGDLVSFLAMKRRERITSSRLSLKKKLVEVQDFRKILIILEEYMEYGEYSTEYYQSHKTLL